MTETTEKGPHFRTQIPNIVDDLGLDPYERALYVHYKRVCGENQGAYCYETVKTTAQKTKMSMGQVSEARKALAERGLILVQDGRPVIVTIANIWDLNTAYYQLEHRPDIEGWTVGQLRNWLSDVHTVNVTSHKDSNIVTRNETNLTYNDSDVHTVNVDSHSERQEPQDDNMSSYVHTVKQRIESINIESNPSKESKRERVESHPLNFEPLTVAIAEICEIDLSVINRGVARELADVQASFCKANKTPAQVLDFEQWRRKYHWSGKSPPSLRQVGQFWGQYEKWVRQGRPDSVENEQQKASLNGHHQRNQGNPSHNQSDQTDGTTEVSRGLAAALKAAARTGGGPSG